MPSQIKSEDQNEIDWSRLQSQPDNEEKLDENLIVESIDVDWALLHKGISEESFSPPLEENSRVNWDELIRDPSCRS